MRRRYHILDVFTDTKLAGNPLAVVLDSDGLDDTAMQAIAREFNLSETVFCSAPRDPVNTAALRIFTPAAELPFAGPSDDRHGGPARHRERAPTSSPARTSGWFSRRRSASSPAACAGVAARRRTRASRRRARPRSGPSRRTSRHWPRSLALPWTTSASKAIARPAFSAGNPVTFVPLASLEALGRAVLVAAPGERCMLYLYARAEPVAGTRAFRSRMLSAGWGVPEDPATGAAAVAFPAVLAAGEPLADGEHDLILLQGFEMGRPSRIGVAFAMEFGRVGPVTIGGYAVVVAQGHLEL